MKRLGKGLEDIIGQSPQAVQVAPSFILLRIEQIRPGRFQPRTTLSEEGLEELKASIKHSGVVEPVIVRPIGHGTYELVAGERRLRAAQGIGLQQVPAIIKTLSDKEALEFSLVENVQRVDLNPVEEARGYSRLLDEFGYTQEEVATTVGKDRATIANLLRLLSLPEEIVNGLASGTVTLGHAKALVAIRERHRQVQLYLRIAKEGLSVRQTEQLAGRLSPAKKRRVARTDPQGQEIEDDLRRLLGTKVSLLVRKKGGRIIIEYFSEEDLIRILRVMGKA